MIALWLGCALVSDADSQERLDPDGDGVSWPHDCDDGDRTVGRPTTWYLDADNDGFGDPDDAVEQCEAPPGRVANADDCDDDAAEAHANGVERCDPNDVDEDCDGVADDEDDDVLDTTEFFVDVDGDGSGTTTTVLACDVGDGVSADSTDCDDADATVNTSAKEVCNDGVDNDCDGGAEACRHSGSVSADVVIQGTNTFALEVKVTPDLNGDGASDLVISSYNAERAWVFPSPITADLTAMDAWATVSGNQPEFAQGVEAGDLDGDGHVDLVLSSEDETYIEDLWANGAVTLLYGPLGAGATTDVGLPRILGQPGSLAGENDAGFAVGDLNNDGMAEIVLGMSTAETSDIGRVAVIAGSATRITGDVDVDDVLLSTIDGANQDDMFGGRVAVLPDTNGDGTPDVVIGSAFATTTLSGGAAWLFEGPVFGNQVSDDADAIISGSFNIAGGLGMGDVVASAGDVNGDGLGDLYVTDTAALRGYLALGPISGDLLGADLEATFAGTTGDAGGTAGDLDGDTMADLLIAKDTSSGTSYIVYGPVSGVVDLTTAPVLGTSGGVRVVDGGADLSGDGLDDVVVGLTNARAHLLFGAGI